MVLRWLKGQPTQTPRKGVALPYRGERKRNVNGLTGDVPAWESADVVDGQGTSAKALGRRNKGLS